MRAVRVTQSESRKIEIGRKEEDRKKERKLIEAAGGLNVSHCSEEDGVCSLIVAIARVVGGENIPDGREQSVLEESCEQWLAVLCMAASEEEEMLPVFRPPATLACRGRREAWTESIEIVREHT